MSDNKGRETMKSKLALIGLAAIFTSPAFGQGVDPLLGTWKYNYEKSHTTDPAPRNWTLTFSGTGQNFINTATGEDDQGPFKVVLMHIYDGMPHPVTGDPNMDSNAFTRVGNTWNAVRFKSGKVVEVGQGVINGKTFTFTYEGIANNQPYHGVRVFDRQ
jgi:hypothetical protein